MKTRILLDHYRAIDSAAEALLATRPLTTEWRRARDRLREVRILIHVREAELAPPGSFYYRGRGQRA